MSTYPITAFNFEVQWGSVKRGGFTEITGLSYEIQPINYREGNLPEFSVIKRPGMVQYPNVTMKRGIMSKDADFADWIQQIPRAGEEASRRDLNIILKDDSGNPTVTWSLKAAWVTKITAPNLNATGNEIAIESIEICHEGLTVNFE